MMNEWYCTKCHRVFLSSSGTCCGPLEVFDVTKHGRFLIGLSNAWITVWKRWDGNPLLEKVAQECADNGCFSAATVLNMFIESLIDRKYE